MKKTILIACLGLVSLGLQAQSISLAGEWNVELGKSGSAFAKSKRASQGEVKRAILPRTPSLLPEPPATPQTPMTLLLTAATVPAVCVPSVMLST